MAGHFLPNGPSAETVITLVDGGLTAVEAALVVGGKIRTVQALYRRRVQERGEDPDFRRVQERKMSPARFAEICSARWVPGKGIRGPFTRFEYAAMRHYRGDLWERWSAIEWEGVLASGDDVDERLLIKIQDQDRRDRFKRDRAIKRSKYRTVPLEENISRSGGEPARPRGSPDYESYRPEADPSIEYSRQLSPGEAARETEEIRRAITNPARPAPPPARTRPRPTSVERETGDPVSYGFQNPAPCRFWTGWHRWPVPREAPYPANFRIREAAAIIAGERIRRTWRPHKGAGGILYARRCKK